MNSQRFSFLPLLLTVFGLLLLTMVISTGVGYSELSFSRIFPVLFGNGTFAESFVLYSVRLPRIFITLLAGAALALSGAILQGLTRNDLADPGIVGINSGAGTAVAVFFLFFPLSAGNFVFLLPVVAFAGALITAALIYLFSYEKNTGLQPGRFILVGVGFSLALSGLMIVLISGADRMKVEFIVQWLAGSIWGTDWPFILALLPWLLVLVPVTYYYARDLNMIGLGTAVATGVGVSMRKTQIRLLLTAVALAASAVSVTGGIAFVGLMAPHIARSLTGADHRRLLPLAMMIGALLLVLADTVGRNLIEPDGLPAGVVVSLLGAPYFIYLLLKRPS
ncbi:FecCD family ABC transporter permease [Alkalicoccus halolimnae]|uniref:Iron ABC transporter permease n=1 Tax=Alkalicoccus halolimnae TaxID=1667239 RepID=A0A5C7FFG5_9BACI|nr:iron ABC transporter permease [Alkalicoccus halolimnae]TXF81182.1 iron ABC transporter permease [Alkalicoccus halolimnae]